MQSPTRARPGRRGSRSRSRCEAPGLSQGVEEGGMRLASSRRSTRSVSEPCQRSKGAGSPSHRNQEQSLPADPQATRPRRLKTAQHQSISSVNSGGQPLSPRHLRSNRPYHHPLSGSGPRFCSLCRCSHHVLNPGLRWPSGAKGVGVLLQGRVCMRPRRRITTPCRPPAPRHACPGSSREHRHRERRALDNLSAPLYLIDRPAN